MSKKQSYNAFLVALSLMLQINLVAQLTINNSLTPQQLVQNVLMGSGVTATNITFTGDKDAIAEFGGTTNIGLSNGVVMTTGTTFGPNGPQGPNNLDDASVDNSQPGDALLSSINSNTTLNAAVLEFDFVPTGDTIKFQYVLGSEEYPEFACGQFNDIFGFFISGPNPNGGNYLNENIALIPGTTLPVSIKNINKGGCSAYPQYYIDNTGGKTIQYDGFTTPLTAIAPVTCGATYHIKLAIADVSDWKYDTGVFLEAGSFSSKSISVKPSVVFGLNDSTIFEGCGKYTLNLTRNSNTVSTVDSITYSLSGTAIKNTDYTLSSSSITSNKIFFPIGKSSVMLDISALQDFAVEGTEYFTITLDLFQCNMLVQKTISIYIADVSPLSVDAGKDTILNCPNTTINLKATASGGVAGSGNYKYSWNDGQVGNTIVVSPKINTTFIVSVKDTCGIFVAKDSVKVSVNYNPLSLTVTGNTEICPGSSTTITANVKFGLPGYKYKWQPSNDSISAITASPNSTTTYTVTVIDKCGLQKQAGIKVIVAQTKADFTYTLNPGQLVYFTNASIDADSLSWFFGDDSTSIIANPLHIYADSGTYKVTLIATNSLGCIDTISKIFTIFPDMYFYFPNSFTPNNDGFNDVYTGKGYGIAHYKMDIYDRWGKLIYRTTDINKGWDGKNEQGKAGIENYVCVFDVGDFFGNSIHRMGVVVLVR